MGAARIAMGVRNEARSVSFPLAAAMLVISAVAVMSVIVASAAPALAQGDAAPAVSFGGACKMSAVWWVSHP
jgi:hypothetical protein